MRRAVLACMVYLAASVSFGGCVASIMVLENPEWRQGVLIPDIDPDVIEKFTVGDVLVYPAASFTDNAMTRITISFVFSSTADTSLISVKEVTVSIGGEELDYGEPINPTEESALSFASYMPPPHSYLVETRVLTVEPPPGKMPGSRVSFSVVVSVREENGKVTEKKIEGHFLAEKRFSLFGEFPLP